MAKFKKKLFVRAIIFLTIIALCFLISIFLTNKFKKNKNILCESSNNFSCIFSDLKLNKLKNKNLNFFKQNNINYLKNTKIYNKEIKNKLKLFNNYNSYPDIFGFGEKYHENNSKKYCSLINNGYVAPVSIKFVSKEIGYGIFAEVDIKKDEMIGECTGIILDRYLVIDTDYAWVYPVKEINLLLDCKHHGNEMRYVNHSNNNNAKKIDVLCNKNIWHPVYIADKDISKGEEITISYGKLYWDTRKK